MTNLKGGIQGYTISGVTKLDPDKTVNYVTCHDNYTLYDRIKAAKITDEDTVKKMAMLANSVVFTSQGVSFMLAGEEFLRTKGGNENSYDASYKVNELDYSLKIKNMDMFENYDNLSTDYVPDNSSIIVSPPEESESTFPLEVYNKKQEFIGYAFNEGDTLDIETGLISYEDNEIKYPYEDYESAKLSIVDLRYDGIYSFEIAPTADKVHIDKYASTLIKQGVYNVEVYVYSKDKQRLVTKYELIVYGGESIEYVHKVLKGDANGDGSINMMDTGVIMRHILGYDVDIDLEAADVNDDGVVDETDYDILGKKIANGEV
jgi:hypothetical protein